MIFNILLIVNSIYNYYIFGMGRENSRWFIATFKLNRSLILTTRTGTVFIELKKIF